MNPFDFFIVGPGGGHGKVWNPPWTNPNKFPRHEPLSGDKDDESMLRIVEIEKLLERQREIREKILDLQEQLGVVQSDVEAHKARLFPMLRKNHPSIVKPEGYYGWRHFGEQYYVVGWDEATIAKYMKEQSEKEGDVPGDDQPDA